MVGPPELQITIAVTLLDRQLLALDTLTIQDWFMNGYRSVRELPLGYEQHSKKLSGTKIRSNRNFGTIHPLRSDS